MDMNKLKSKLVELKSQSGAGKLLWKPKPGKQTIRIVPYVHDREWPFVELFFHYNISKKTLISPFTFKRPDPIKEFAEKLQSTGDTDDWKQGKKLEPTRRIYVPILVRGEEKDGVKFWGFGTQIYDGLLKKIENPKWGDITHPLEGRDIEVTFEKASGTSPFPKTEIDVDPERSPVTKDRDVLELMKAMPDVSTLWAEPTYDELNAILHEYIENGGKPVDTPDAQRTDDSDDEAGTTAAVSAGTQPVSTTSAGVSSDADVEEVFKSYFNK